MKIISSKYLTLLFFLCLLVASNTVTAQKKDSGKKERPVKPAKPAKATKKRSSPEAIEAQIMSMTREDKNNLTHCPITGRKMSLSDNYQANGEEQEGTEKYPMAYQLGYRRYCDRCTRILDKKQRKKQVAVKDSDTDSKSEEKARCEVYGNVLFANPDYDPEKEVKDVDPEMPHAKQYGKKNYCKTCTKIYKIRAADGR